MENDKRQSLRLPLSLPFAWHSFSELPCRIELENHFSQNQRSHTAQRLGHLRTIDKELQKAISGIDDLQVQQVFSLLDQKYSLLTQNSTFAMPACQDIVLSLEGVSFSCDKQFSRDNALGIHIVLDGYHFFSPALVSGRAQLLDKQTYRCGVRFCDLSQVDAKCLSRYLMRCASRSSPVD